MGQLSPHGEFKGDNSKEGGRGMKMHQMTVANPQKGRLETINVEFTEENTTWFENSWKPGDIATITDYNDGDLLIKEYGYTYPVLIYDTTRAAIGYKRNEAKKILRQALRE
jgi:hypothetical protein